jgi:hypothetical protein
MGVRERTLAGRYRIQEVIGRGGMSTVYRATDEVLGRDVAVKVLLPALAEQDPTYAARFEREARAAAGLASPTVVTVFDTGTDEDGSQYIVMELVSGHSLAELLSKGQPLPVEEATRIGERVADALQAAHAAGILHRDIKPANVMVADDGTVKLLDFGIARSLDGVTLTQAASVVGTAAYMAPERALGQSGDARADVYSLGCLLYAMLTGRPPFSGEIAAAVLHQQINADPAPPSRLRAEVPAALEALVLAMLAKAPDARPKTAAEVGERLAALSGGATASTVPLGAAAAATVPLGTAATTPLARSRRRSAFAAVMGDHRWRAAVMGLITAAVALAAVLLLAGGGSSPKPKSHPATTQAVTHQTPPPTTQATTPKPPTTPAPKPPGPKAHHENQPGPPGPHHGHGGGGNGGGDGGDGGGG